VKLRRIGWKPQKTKSQNQQVVSKPDEGKPAPIAGKYTEKLDIRDELTIPILFIVISTFVVVKKKK